MVSLSLLGFKLLSGQGFNVPCHCDLDLLPTDRKINGDHLWVMANYDTNYDVPKLNRDQVI